MAESSSLGELILHGLQFGIDLTREFLLLGEALQVPPAEAGMLTEATSELPLPTPLHLQVSVGRVQSTCNAG